MIQVRLLSNRQFIDFFWDKPQLLSGFKFISQRNLSSLGEENKLYFIGFDENIPKVIGILCEDFDFPSKLGRFTSNKVYRIEYIVVSKMWEGNGFSRILIDNIISWAKENEISLLVQSYSPESYRKISGYLHQKSKQMGVWLYDTKKIDY